jgi:large subunit ribosomal protein L13
MKTTKSTKATDIKRVWHTVDVKGKMLGRASSEIAQLLMGKSKSYFVRNLDCGDFVAVINAKDIKVTGKKMDQKVYYRYSGYPGGLFKETLAEKMQKKPKDVIRLAVKGMLPQNRLRDRMLKRLLISLDEKNPHVEKVQTKKEVKE